METDRTRALILTAERYPASSMQSTNTHHVPLRRSLPISRVTKVSHRSQDRQLSLNDSVCS